MKCPILWWKYTVLESIRSFRTPTLMDQRSEKYFSREKYFQQEMVLYYCSTQQASIQFLHSSSWRIWSIWIRDPWTEGSIDRTVRFHPKIAFLKLARFDLVLDLFKFTISVRYRQFETVDPWFWIRKMFFSGSPIIQSQFKIAFIISANCCGTWYQAQYYR